MRLFTGPMSMFGAKAQIAVAEKGLAHEIVMVPFGMRRRYHPKDPEVLRLNPKGQVPVLIDGPIEVIDSTQIFEHLEAAYPEPPLWPRDVATLTRARQMEWASDEIYFPFVVRLMVTPDPQAPERAQACSAIAAHRHGLDAVLEREGFLCGAFSYADIAYVMADLFAAALGAPATDAPRFNAWRARVLDRPAVRGVVEPMVRFMTEHGVRTPDARLLDKPTSLPPETPARARTRHQTEIRQ